MHTVTIEPDLSSRQGNKITVVTTREAPTVYIDVRLTCTNTSYGGII